MHQDTSDRLTRQIADRDAVISELEFELRQQADDVEGERKRALRAQKLSNDANSYVICTVLVHAVKCTTFALRECCGVSVLHVYTN